MNTLRAITTLTVRALLCLHAAADDKHAAGTQPANNPWFQQAELTSSDRPYDPRFFDLGQRQYDRLDRRRRGIRLRQVRRTIAGAAYTAGEDIFGAGYKFLYGSRTL
jgi:hypothetical protein